MKNNFGDLVGKISEGLESSFYFALVIYTINSLLITIQCNNVSIHERKK